MFSFDSGKFKIEKGDFSFTGAPVKKLRTIELPDMINTVFCAPILRCPGGAWRMYYITEKGKPGYAKRKSCFIESSDGEFRHQNMLGEISCVNLPNEAELRMTSVLLVDDQYWKMFAWLFHDGKIRYIMLDSEDGIEWRALNVDNPCLLHPNDIDAGGSVGLAGLTPGRGGGVENKLQKYLPSKQSLRQIRTIMSNDATYTYYNQEKSLYELYSVWLADNCPGSVHHVSYDNAPEIIRIIQRRESRDGIRWSEPELVLVPDEFDNDSMQFYYLSMTFYAGWRIGVLGRYLCSEQQIEPELCFSRDGSHWQRPLRKAFIKRTGNDANAELIHMSHHFVDCDDHWKIYYNSSYFFHNDFMQSNPAPRKREIKIATLPKNRFIGLHGSGSLITEAFVGCEDEIVLDADIDGHFSVEVLDVNGDVMPGHEKKAFSPVRIDEQKICLQWNCSKEQKIIYSACRLRIMADNITLYRITTTLSKKTKKGCINHE